MITRCERLIGLGCEEYGGHIKALDSVIFLCLSPNSDCLIGQMGKFGGGGGGPALPSGDAHAVLCQMWSVIHIYMQDKEESPLG